jgi:hypothetical protein
MSSEREQAIDKVTIDDVVPGPATSQILIIIALVWGDDTIREYLTRQFARLSHCT